MLRPRWIGRPPLYAAALPALLLLGATVPAGAQSRISFEENHGQTNPAVRFVGRGKASTLFLTANEMILARPSHRDALVRMRVDGAATPPTIAGKDALPGNVYYATPEAQGALTAAATFRRVQYSNIYPGVDLEYYGKDDQLEFDFTVAPHVDPGRIHLSFNGSDRVLVDANGDLRVRTGTDDVLMKRPIVYQEREGMRRGVAAHYVVSGRRHRDVRFAIGEYDQSLPLIIDPAIVYATYSGGGGNETVISTEVNKAGEVYVLGSTTALPTLPINQAGTTSPLRIVPGNTDPIYTPLYCFVEKLTADATQMAFRVYFQGFRECEAFTVAPSGAVHLAMRAPYSFGGFAQLRTLTGDDGSHNALSLSISNLNGGPLDTIPGRPFVVKDIKADSSENVYLLYQQLVQGDSALQSRLMKVTASGDVVGTPFDIGLYDFGPGFGDNAVAMAVDEFGQVLVTGNTNSGSFPTTPNAFQQSRSMGLCRQDVFLMHVDTAQNPWATPYATLLGGTSCDSALGIVRDPLGFIYLMGRTLSSDFPMNPAAFESSPNLAQGVGDGFIVKLDLTQAPGDQMVGGTFLGMEYFGPANGTRDSSHPLVVLPGGELAVTGAGGFGMLLFNELFDASASNQPFQKFIEVFAPGGTGLLLGTNLDNTGQAAYSLIAGNGTRNLYSTIETAEDGRATSGVTQPVRGGGIDLLVSKFDLSDIITNMPPVVDLGPGRTLFAGASTTVDFDLANSPLNVYDLDGVVTTYTWRIDGGAPQIYFPPFAATQSLSLGRHILTLAVTDDGGATSGDTLIVDVDSGGGGGTNSPPDVQADDVTAVATSPAGANVVLRGTATDPDGDTLTIAWTGPFPTIQYDVSRYFSGNAAVFALLPIGANQATLTVDDHNGHIITRVVNVTVLATNTNAGTGIDVSVPDDRNAVANGFTPGRMTVRFDNVATIGLTWLRTRTDQIPPPPPGKQLGSAPYYYDVTTTATGSGNIRLCVDATGMSFVDASHAQLYRLNGTSWNDISAAPTAAETAGHLMCGVVPFFGSATFALFTTADESTRVTTIAGNGASYMPGDPVPLNPVPPASVPLTFPEGMAFDTAHNFMYVADAYRIQRIDLSTNLLKTIAGNGSANFDDRRYNVDGLATPLFHNGAIALDRAGNLYFSDANGCGILRLEPRNNFSSYFLTRVAGKGPDPMTLECHDSGDGGRADDADVNSTGRFAFDAAGNLFLVHNAFARGYVLRRITPGADGVITGGDPDEIITTVAGGGSTWPPFGDPHNVSFGGSLFDLTFSPQGDLYLAVFGLVERLTPAPGASVIDGRPGETLSSVSGGGFLQFLPFQGDGGPAISADWGGASSVAVLPGGDLVVADIGFNRLRRISAGADGVVNGGNDETITTIAGFSENGVPAFNGDGYALSTSFYSPRKVIVDPRGGIDVADFGFNRIRHIGPAIASPGADLSVTITGLDSVGVNSIVAYHVTVTNHGPAAATGVGVSMPVGADLSPTASSPAGFCVVPIGFPLPIGGTIFCDGGSLLPGQSVQITISLTPKHIGTLTSTVTVGAAQADPVSDNNSASVDTEVDPSADLSISPLAPSSGTTVQVGVPVTYQMTFANLGPNDVRSVARLRAAIPAGLQFVSATLSGAVCDGSGGVLTCDIDQFAAGMSATATIVLTPLATGQTTITFDASSSDFDSDYSNNSATIAVNRLPVMAHTIDVTETIHVRDEIPFSGGSILQADLSLTEAIRVRDEIPISGSSILQAALSLAEAIRVHDDVLANGSGNAGSAHPDLSIAEPIRVRDQFPLSGNGLAQAGLTITDAVHIVDSPVIPVATHTIIASGGVRYKALDPNGGDTGVTVQFTSVVVPGILTASLMASPPPPPSGFTFVGGVYDVVLISGSVTPPIELCFSGTGFTAANRVLHHETIGGVAQWVDRTTLQTATQVCATVNSLSPFALAVRQSQPAPDGLMYGVGFVNNGRQHDHFVFQASQRNGRDSGRLELWINEPRFCREDDDFDRDRDFDGGHDNNYGRDHHNPPGRFEATAIADVTFSDDPSVRPGPAPGGQAVVDTVHLKGTGRWNGGTGYSFEATASDRGEPGRNRDTFSIVIKDSRGAVVASVSGVIDGGNIQSIGIRR